MKKAIYILLFIITLTGIAVGYFYNKSMHIATYQSPDNNYELIIKSNRSIFAVTMPGDGGSSMPVKVILKNANGKVIGTSNNNCETLLFSINIHWDLENNEVFYATARSINLKTGKVEC